MLLLFATTGACMAAEADSPQGTDAPTGASAAASANASASAPAGNAAPQPATTGPADISDNGGVQPANPADPAAVRKEVFSLATSGGAIKALDEAKSRPDLFNAIDLAQFQELAIRQQVHGGRDKARAMSSPDRFDGLNAALKDADQFEANLPRTPEYTPVRNALNGDRTVAYAARGDMAKAVATFEAIPPDAPVSIDALSGAGDAYLYLNEPAKAQAAYQRGLDQADKSAADAATRGYEYGARLRPIDLRSGLFWAAIDQGHATDASQVLDNMGKALPPASQVHPGDPANDDYLRYYRLRAQYLIYTGRTTEGVAELEKLQKQVPFNAEIRTALADAESDQGHPRRAIAMYTSTLTDHPDNVEVIAGLGRAQLASDNYEQATRIDQTLGTTFPDNGSVRGFKRDYNAYRSPEVTTDLTYEHGNGALADNAFTSDTYVFSMPFADNWRVFSHTFYGFGNTDIGSVSRTRTGLGGEFRQGPLNLQAEVTRSFGPDGRLGGRGSVTYNLNDYWTVSATANSDDNSLPWKAYVSHLWGRSANVDVNWHPADGRQLELSYGVSRYSDSNLSQDITMTGTQRVFATANQLVNLSLSASTDSNTLQNTPYFSPARSYSVAATAMHQWMAWKQGDMSLKQRIYLTGGLFNERGFGSSAMWDARLEHAWSFKHDITLSYGIDVANHAYDGKRELSETGFMSFRMPF